MRRDSIFYKIFSQTPDLLFSLLPEAPPNAAQYRFDSVTIKEPRFEIDGVFLPPDSIPLGIVYFCEVQFQKDNCFYERLFAEILLYFYQNRDRYSNWKAVVIYPSRSTEQDEIEPYQFILNSPQVYRVYLDELGDIRQLPIGLAVMVLTTLSPTQSPTEARHLLSRVQQEIPSPSVSQSIIEIVTTIIVYQFTQLSRQEVEKMLAIKLKETRVYQEARQEGREEGREEGRLQEARLILRLLSRRCGKLPKTLSNQISTLTTPLLEELGEALLDFSSVEDLRTWLKANHTHHS